MPRKGENIYKRKDGRWEGRYIKCRMEDQKVYYGYVYARTYREVKAKLMKAKADKDKATANTVREKPADLYQNVVAEWLQEIQPQVKESTFNKYRNLLDAYILPKLGEVSVNRISNEMIELLCKNLLTNGGVKHTGLSPKTVSDVLSVIRSVLKFANKKGKIVLCDARFIQVKQGMQEMRVLSHSEQEKLCRYLYSDLNPYNIGILVCLFTGLRVGEICALRWKDISLKDQTIYIHQTMQRIQDKAAAEKKTKLVVTTPKSSCSVRTIPIPDDLAEIIANYQTSTDGYFLTNSDKKCIEPRTMQNRFKKALQKSYVSDANYHSLRHTFATNCVELGFDVKSLSEILGHASVNITMNRYVHPSMELKRKNMQRLSALLAVR